MILFQIRLLFEVIIQVADFDEIIAFKYSKRLSVIS